MDTVTIGTIESHGKNFRVSFSCGLDPISGKYRRIRVGPFRRKGDALNAHEELQAYALEAAWTELITYAEQEIVEDGRVTKASWSTSGWDPLERPSFDTMTGLAKGFIEWRRTHPWGRNDRWPIAAESTIEAYRTALASMDHSKIPARVRIGEKAPKRVTRGDIEKFMRELQCATSGDAATRCVDLIRQVLEWGSSVVGVLPRNVARDLRGPGRGSAPEEAVELWDSAGSLLETPQGAFTPSELKAVLSAAYTYDPALGILAEACVRMARLGEAAALREETAFILSADGKHAEMRIEGGICPRRGGGTIRTPGKHIGRNTDIVKRSIPIPVGFYARVEDWKLSEERKRRSAIRGNPLSLLLLNRRGNPVTLGTWRQLQSQVYQAAGFAKAEIRRRKLTANSLRHSGITSAVLNGHSPELIAVNAGNSADMIRRVYFRPTKRELEEIAMDLVEF